MKQQYENVLVHGLDQAVVSFERKLFKSKNTKGTLVTALARCHVLFFMPA